MHRIAIAGIVAAGLLCTGAAFAQQATPSFARDIVPLIKFRCVACHLTGEESGSLALYPAAAYASLVDKASVGGPLKRVEPGEPDRSYLVRKLEGTHIEVGGSGMRMPLDGAWLSDAETAMIRAWIGAGAPDN